jgi:outer membrane protein assembly factor BamE
MRHVLPFAFAALLLASGCIHKIDIQQGNVVIQENLAKVKPGMSRAEVRTILGTPLLTDAFHANRWDYYFYNAKGGREVEKNRITVVFENEKVARVDGTAPVAIKGEERVK